MWLAIIMLVWHSQTAGQTLETPVIIDAIALIMTPL